ncbi:ATP-binding cassette domain-containing protein [Actinotalea ferrariae]|uniref:ABC transporter ATP-binding protein n=1 Tax=Actinotalea ferrariae TaxID=1386098 RepID=UPI001C8B2B2F|nr:ATP-binding cassette domain-containing protein [Actinotalea ferrariae]MBX9244740.1 ATP-binding cassette domain-containing protein [Actinotalea ferrariae]
MPLIEASQLTKVFRRADKDPGLAGSLKHLVQRRFTEHVAVDRVDLSIGAGEAVAYVGPNGAGKSTTIKMLTGILVPTSGQVRVGGLVPHERRIENARQIGVVFGQRTQLWWDLPVRESLGLLRDMYGIGERTYQQQLERFDAILGIGEFLPQMARKLSLGQRMRADLAAALLHEPRIVYLDEPTIGLDISVKDRVRAFVKELVDGGTTVMLTTHDLGDIQDICRRIVIIDGGRTIYDGSLAAVADRYARDRGMTFQLREPLGSLAALTAALPAATVAAGGHDREVSVRFDRFTLDAGRVLTGVLGVAEVVDVAIEEPAIEDVIRKVYLGELALDATARPGTADDVVPGGTA